MMKISESVKPISYLKSHVSEIIKNFKKNQKTIIVTQNGEAKAIFQDIETYEQTQDSLALLKLLAISNTHKKEKKYKSMDESFISIREQIKNYKK